MMQLYCCSSLFLHILTFCSGLTIISLLMSRWPCANPRSCRMTSFSVILFSTWIISEHLLWYSLMYVFRGIQESLFTITRPLTGNVLSPWPVSPITKSTIYNIPLSILLSFELTFLHDHRHNRLYYITFVSLLSWS